ncbi:MAG: mannose-1-phosphate guanylyltransferase [Ignavibacteriales bacterium]|nr:mannose-1-phosphate guanylyltransferase [Ignavibacteriales bacterium]
MKVFAIVMAGGIGSRFWPRSREKTPKQLLSIFGEQSIIQSTIKRINKSIPFENIFIVTNIHQKDAMMEQLPELPAANFLVEPFGRNTAACIGLAALFIRKIDQEAVTVVLPADHLIYDEDSFHKNLQQAISFAYAKKNLVTIGIMPTRPETGYGYVQVKETEAAENVFPVNSFAEKPNYATAVRFLESGDFFWNSGMFIWRIDTFFEELQMYMPELLYSLEKIADKIGTEEYESTLNEVYAQIKSISIDYGIMEKSHRVFLVKSAFRWSDVGSWEEVYQLSQKDENNNSFDGDVYAENSRESYVYAPGKFTALIGVDNVIVIDTGDALLVCRRDLSQNVKKVVDYLKSEQKEQLL